MANQPTNNLGWLSAVDPDSAMNMQQIQNNQAIAQQLLSQGLQKEPAYSTVGGMVIPGGKLQGITKLAQTLLGRSDLNQANKDMVNAQGQQYANIMNQMSPQQNDDGSQKQSGINPIGMNPKLAAMMLTQNPEEYFKTQSELYKPTGEMKNAKFATAGNDHLAQSIMQGDMVNKGSGMIAGGGQAALIPGYTSAINARKAAETPYQTQNVESITPDGKIVSQQGLLNPMNPTGMIPLGLPIPLQDKSMQGAAGTARGGVLGGTVSTVDLDPKSPTYGAPKSVLGDQVFYQPNQTPINNIIGSAANISASNPLISKQNLSKGESTRNSILSNELSDENNALVQAQKNGDNDNIQAHQRNITALNKELGIKPSNQSPFSLGGNQPVKSNGVVTALSPAQVDFNKNVAGDNATYYAGTQSKAAASADNLNALSNVEKIVNGDTKFGPGTQNYIDTLSAARGVIPNTKGLTDTQVLGKYTERLLRGQQRDNSTDRDLSSIQKANINPEMTNGAIKELLPNLKAREIANQTEANAANQWLKNNGNDQKSLNDFRSTWNSNYDPRIFVASQLNPTQRGAFIKNQPDSSQLLNKIHVFGTNGWIK